MIIDTHTHVGHDKDGTVMTIERLLQDMKANGIDKSVVFPLNEAEKPLIDASMELLEMSKSYPVIPFLRIDPHDMDAGKLAVLISKGFYGVKLHPRSQNFDPLDKTFENVFKAISDSRKPVLIHTRKENNPNTDPRRVMLLAEAYPDMNLILGHFGHSDTSILDYVKEHKNLYMETSVWSVNTLIKPVADKIGIDRVIFGSDAPYSDIEIEKLKVQRSGLNEHDQELVFSRNIMKLLELQ